MANLYSVLPLKPITRALKCCYSPIAIGCVAACLSIDVAQSFGDRIRLTQLNGNDGFRVSGVHGVGQMGRAVDIIGDINGDGFEDIAVAANFASSPYDIYTGQVYVIFGQSTGFPATLKPRQLDGHNGFTINGRTIGHRIGRSLAGVGDVNNDNVDDLLIGSPNPREAYLIYGRTDGFSAVLDLSPVTNDQGLVIEDTDSDDNGQLGVSASAAGDFNGDGIADFMLGADYYANRAGRVYLIFGRSQGFGEYTLPLSVLDGTNGFALNGIDAGDHTGYNVSAVGDFNSDGFDDVVIGGRGTTSQLGRSYLVFGHSNNFPSELELSTLDGSNGFVINDTEIDDNAFIAVTGIDDINGDNIADIVIGVDRADPNNRGDAGQSCVIFGRTQAFSSGSLDLSELDGTNGFFINGASAGDLSGRALSSGDINGDGYSDLVIGAFTGITDDRPVGQTYVVFGPIDDLAPELELSTLDGTNGFVINGINSFDRVGAEVGSGDINDDGYDDLVIGAFQTDDNRVNSGQSYVVFGHGGVFTPTLELSTLNGVNGFTIKGPQGGDLSGYAVSGAGDINGDTIADFVVATPYGDRDPFGEDEGQCYVLFGRSDPFPSNQQLSNLDDNNGFIINGIDTDDGACRTVSELNDVNGDNLNDLLIGAPHANPNGLDSGQVYVVFGRTNPFPTILELSSLDGANGFVLNGVNPGDYAGASVDNAGDVNDDGMNDLIIGAPKAATNGAASGQSYVVFGHPQGFSSTLELANLDGSNGFRINGGNAGDEAGWSVRGAGDVNNDTIDDVIIGAPFADTNGNDSGQAHIVFGRSSNFPPVLELSALANGFTIQGPNAEDNAGIAVAGIGDFNGDSIDDLAIGAPYNDENGDDSGRAYIVLGRSNGFSSSLELSSLDSNSGLIFQGANDGDRLGRVISQAGDINGDELADLIILALESFTTPGSEIRGFIVFGTSDHLDTTINLDVGNPSTRRFVIDDILFPIRGDQGLFITPIGDTNVASAAGDVNNDGVDDVTFGSPFITSNGRFSGQSFVLYGRQSNLDIKVNGVPAEVGMNEQLDLTFTVTNQGPTLTTSLTVQIEPLPLALNYESGGGSGWSCEDNPSWPMKCVLTSPLVLDNESNTALTIRTKTQCPGLASVTATVGSSDFDPDTADNIITTTILVKGEINSSDSACFIFNDQFEEN